MLRKKPRRHPALLQRLGRAQLRTRVLAGVLLIMLAALIAFDFSAVTALRGYLLGHTDEQLQEVVGLYRAVAARPVTAPAVSRVISLSGTVAGEWQPVATAHAQLSAAQAQAQDPSWAIVGPRVRLRASVLDQFYVAYREGTTQIRLVHGNPDLIPAVMVAEWTGPARASAPWPAATATSSCGCRPCGWRAAR